MYYARIVPINRRRLMMMNTVYRVYYTLYNIHVHHDIELNMYIYTYTYTYIYILLNGACALIIVTDCNMHAVVMTTSLQCVKCDIVTHSNNDVPRSSLKAIDISPSLSIDVSVLADNDR